MNQIHFRNGSVPQREYNGGGFQVSKRGVEKSERIG